MSNSPPNSPGTVLVLLAGLCLSGAAPAADYPAVDCVIQPHRIVDLGSPVAGVIDEILVERSDQVSSGQPVARIENSVELATVELARARAKVDAQLEIEKINIVYDRKSQDRITSLYGRKVIPIDSKDAADREAELSSLRLQQVRDLQEVRNRELDRAEELVRQKTIRSTIDGFVVEQFKSEGEFVEDQPILRIAQLDPLKVDAIVPISYFGQIRKGMRAEVSPELGADNLLRAEVTVVDRIGDAASGTFGVQLELDNPGFGVPAGLKCEVRFMETPEAVMRAAEAEAEKRPPEPRSYVAGPFKTEEDLQDFRRHIGDIPHERREEWVTEAENFMVITAVGIEEDIVRLIEAGTLKDYRKLHEEPFAGRYSVGVYSTRDRAEKRQSRLAELGVETDITIRTRQQQQWWIDILVSADDQNHRVISLRSQGYPVVAGRYAIAGS